jgi:hypothetical protein
MLRLPTKTNKSFFSYYTSRLQIALCPPRGFIQVLKQFLGKGDILRVSHQPRRGQADYVEDVSIRMATVISARLRLPTI